MYIKEKQKLGNSKIYCQWFSKRDEAIYASDAYTIGANGLNRFFGVYHDE